MIIKFKKSVDFSNSSKWIKNPIKRIQLSQKEILLLSSVFFVFGMISGILIF